MEKVKSLGIVVAIALAISSFFVGGNTVVNNPTQVIEKTVEGVSSDASHKFFGAGVTVGGQVLATTTSVATYTLVGPDLVNKTVLSINESVDLTLNFGATSTALLVPKIGDVAQVYLRNASTTAASAITVAAKDLSVDLQKVEATGGDLVLNGLDWAKITLIRNALSGNSQVTVIFDEMTEAD